MAHILTAPAGCGRRVPDRRQDLFLQNNAISFDAWGGDANRLQLRRFFLRMPADLFSLTR
jgi:hypothetical protein